MAVNQQPDEPALSLGDMSSAQPALHARLSLNRNAGIKAIPHHQGGSLLFYFFIFSILFYNE
jgi:hypothetical protein